MLHSFFFFLSNISNKHELIVTGACCVRWPRTVHCDDELFYTTLQYNNVRTTTTATTEATTTWLFNVSTTSKNLFTHCPVLSKGGSRPPNPLTNCENGCMYLCLVPTLDTTKNKVIIIERLIIIIIGINYESMIIIIAYLSTYSYQVYTTSVVQLAAAAACCCCCYAVVCWCCCWSLHTYKHTQTTTTAVSYLVLVYFIVSYIVQQYSSTDSTSR